MGDVGCTDLWRSSDCSSERHHAFSGGFLPADLRKESNGAKPNAECFSAAGNGPERSQARAPITVCDLWRRGAGSIYLATLVRTESRQQNAARQHVRNYRNYGACHLSSAAAGG